MSKKKKVVTNLKLVKSSIDDKVVGVKEVDPVGLENKASQEPADNIQDTTDKSIGDKTSETEDNPVDEVIQDNPTTDKVVEDVQPEVISEKVGDEEVVSEIPDDDYIEEIPTDEVIEDDKDVPIEEVNKDSQDNQDDLDGQGGEGNSADPDSDIHNHQEDYSDEDGDIKYYIDEKDYVRLEALSDDEAVIELDKLTGQNDQIEERDYLSSLVSQDDRLVYYEIENIYSNDKKRVFKSRLRLRRDPPVLVVKDDFGNEAKFYLTENLTDELSETLRQVKRAYHGFNNPSDINMPEKLLDRIKYYIKNNPFKVLASIFLVIFIISLSI